MTASTPLTPDPAPPGGLSPADYELLRHDVPRDGSADYHSPAPEPIDWEARVKAIADRSRPHRQAQAAARTRREAILAGERRKRTEELNRGRSLAQVPARYRDATADHPEVARWAAAARRDLRAANGLVLNGPTGCGKTWQAYGAWHSVAQHTGCRALALDVPAFLDSLRPGRTAPVTLEDAERAELLLLDDLAGERSSDWTLEVIYRLVNARWNACLPTIVTVNAPGTVIRDQLGDRVASRLNGLGRRITWPADAPDRRVRPGG